jgi:hypothetical protein
MSETQSHAAIDLMRTMIQGSGPMRARFGTQLQSLADAQKEMLTEFEHLSHAWFARRRDGAEAAAEATRQMCGCNDLAEAFLAYQRWLSGSVGRLTADTLEMQAHGARIMRAMTTALRVAEPEPSAPPAREPEAAHPPRRARQDEHRAAA